MSLELEFISVLPFAGIYEAGKKIHLSDETKTNMELRFV